MEQTVDRHILRLRIACAGMLAGLAVYAVIALVVPIRVGPALPQGEALLWGFAFLAAVNLVTIMPVYRVMLAAPRRVYAVGQQPERLLSAHFSAHLVAFARLEAVAVLGVVLFFLTGSRSWFAIFTVVAALGMLLLWPARAKVEALLGAGQPQAPATTPS